MELTYRGGPVANKIGTTGCGIGPSYSTKAARSGIRLSEVFNAEVFEMKIRRLASSFKKRYGDLLKYDVEEEIARFSEYRPKLAKYAVDDVAFMMEAQDKNMKILVEGANGLMLDIDYGTVRITSDYVLLHVPAHSMSKKNSSTRM